MPFILTCDHCQAKLRTAAEVVAGRVVTCPKCGDQFEARSDNQREEGKAAPTWEVVEDDPPPRRSASRREWEEDDDELVRRRSRDDDWDEDDDRPRRRENRESRGKSGRSKLALWIGGGAAVLLLIGVGVYFATRGGSSGVTADRQGARAAEEVDARPKRELPPELFAFWPGEPYWITFSDHTFAPETDATAKVTLTDQAKALGLSADQVMHSVNYSGLMASGRVVGYSLRGPIDLRQNATRAKWKELKTPMGAVFQGTSSTDQPFQAFQPKPNIVVILQPSTSLVYAATDTKLAEEMMKRGSGDKSIPAALWELMHEVSTFPRVSGKVCGKDEEFMRIDAKYRVDGYARSPTQTEELTCWEFPSPDEAKRAEVAQKQVNNQTGTGSRPGREVRYWIKGNRLYRLIREQQAEKK